ncbi:MAG: hypothetical protein U9P42_02715 [Candidatus Fermentibacteria bacterium]|nr:hypothetical protein [Candidatus Fermentibacteria bacterium]
MDKSFIPTEDINLIRNEQVISKEALLVPGISGFTHITELLARNGKEGTEELTSLLNYYFDKMITLITIFSSYIITFLGDSVPDRFDKELNSLNCAKEMPEVMATFCMGYYPERDFEAFYRHKEDKFADFLIKAAFLTPSRIRRVALSRYTSGRKAIRDLSGRNM